MLKRMCKLVELEIGSGGQKNNIHQDEEKMGI